METSTSKDPLEHTANIKQELRKLSEHIREDVDTVNDARAKALFEVSAEVIDGLQKAFTDFEIKNESAWINQNPLKG